MKILRYIQYIKESDSRLDIDPFGEEEWEDDDLTRLLFFANKQNKPYDQIISLNCNGRELTNLDGVEKLLNLENLSCYKNQLNSLNGIENLVNLKFLSCNNNQLTNLNGIENLVNLKELYCHNNLLTNLDEIEDLINLKILTCFNNQFSDKYKKYLENYCKIKNIRIVEKMT